MHALNRQMADPPDLEGRVMKGSRGLMILGAICLAGICGVANSSYQPPRPAPWQLENYATETAALNGRGYFTPYQDIGIGSTLQSIAQSTGQEYYTLAFMLGNGCNAMWEGTIPLNQTSTYLPTLDSDISYIRSQGGDVSISFGGEAGQELAQTCTSASSLQAAYQAVIDQYNVTCKFKYFIV
jgi:hypothetical protein